MNRFLGDSILSKRILFSLLLVVLSCAGLQAQITRYVSTTGTSAPAGAASWATSTSSLQGAIDYVAANGGGQVWVAGGVYKPTTGTDRSVSFSMKNGVAIYGGFRGDETDLSSRPNVNPVTGQPASSTLSGDINNDGLPGGNSYNIFYHAYGTDLNSTARIDGFVITGGNADDTFNKDVGGAFYNNWNNSPVIANCAFLKNSASNQGGAIYSGRYSNLTLTDCLFQENNAGEGGSVFNDRQTIASFTACKFQGNSAYDGGVFFNDDESNVTLTSCTLVSNSSGNEGGVFYSSFQNTTRLTDCILQDNTAVKKGGAFYNDRNGVYLINCTLRNNTSLDGGAFYNEGNGTILTNCVMEKNVADGSGGVFFNYSGYPTLSNCTLQMNRANKGGVFYGQGGSPVLTDCMLQNNTATVGGVFFNDYNSDPRLTNCTLQNNRATQDGGVFYDFGGNSTLINCLLQHNQSNGRGGVAYCESGDISFRDSFMQSNTAVQGGVLYGINCYFGMYNCTLQKNLATNTGGAIYNEESNPALVDCRLLSNTATTGGACYFDMGSPGIINSILSDNVARNGAAIYSLTGAEVKLINSVLQNNQAIEKGGAFYNASESAPRLTNCSIQNNSAGEGGAFFNDDSSEPALTNCVLWNNGGNKTFTNINSARVTLTYSLFEPVAGSAGDVITSDPNNLTTNTSPFVSTTSVTLKTGSPAIDKGSSQLYKSAGGPNTDVAGNPRFVGTQCQIDMGALELQQTGAGINTSVQFTSQPAAGSVVCSGNAVSVAVSVTGTVTGYQWYQKGSSGVTTPIGSQTAATLSLTSVQTMDQGTYWVVATGGCNSVTSTIFTLTVKALPSVTATAAPSTTVSCTNPVLTLTAQTTATAFRWSNSSGTSQTLPVSQPGVYAVTVTDGNGCTAISNSLTISQDNTSPTVSISAASNQLTCTLPAITLTATASTAALRWSTGETTASISVTQTGTYSVSASGANGCTAVSNNLPVDQNFTLPPFAITSVTICPNQTLSLNAVGCSGQVRWSTSATGAMITLTAGSSTSVLTATCTQGICETTASGTIVVGGIQPPPAQILSLTTDESACPVRLSGRGVASSFTVTGPGSYVFSTVYREGGTHEVIALNVKQAGIYTLTATYTNSCGTSAPVTRSVTVSRNCP